MNTKQQDFLIPINDEIGTITWFEHIEPVRFIYKKDALQPVIPKGSIAIDIGAHVGYFSLLFGSCVGKEGKVLAFEPNSVTFDVLKKYSEVNPLNIIPYNLAITPENKKYTFHYTDSNHWGIATNGGFFNELELGNDIKNVHSQPVEVNGVNIIDFINEHYSDEIDKIKFIKMDTEGNDKEIIKTLGPIIKRNRPVLMVEAFQQLSSDEIVDFFDSIKKHDYEIYDISPMDSQLDSVGPLTLEEFEFNIHYINKNGNFLCVHKDDTHTYGLPTSVPNKTSIIIVDRNDDTKNKSEFLDRLNVMLDTFDEVIYVDWNSPNGSFLWEIIKDIPKRGKIKHFTIPPEVANILTEQYSNNISHIHKSLAFNIGLRRTDAEWVAFSSMDTISPTKNIFDEFLSKVNKNTLYVFNHDFQLAPKNLWIKIKGGEEGITNANYVLENTQKKAYISDLKIEKINSISLITTKEQQYIIDSNYDQWVTYYSTHKKGEEFQKYEFLASYNNEYWGLSNIDIEFEII